MTPAGAERRALRPLWMLATGSVAGALLVAVAPATQVPRLGPGLAVIGTVLALLGIHGRRRCLLWLAAGALIAFGRGVQSSGSLAAVEGLLSDGDGAALRVKAVVDAGWETTRWGYRAPVRVRSARRGEDRIDLGGRWRIEVRAVHDPTVLPAPGSGFETLAAIRGGPRTPFLMVAAPAMLEVRSPPGGVARLRDLMASALVDSAGVDPRRIRSAELAGAIALGRRDLMSTDRREGWRRSGMAHLLAVSGLHVGAVAGVLWLLLTAADLHPRRIRWVVLAALPTYAVVAGAAPSAVRAALMGVVFLAGRQLGRAVIPMAAVLSVASTLLYWDPGLVADAGFQLTVLVTAALVRWVPAMATRLPGPAWLAGGVSAPLVAQLAAAPIVACHFRSAIPGAVAANLLVPLLIGPTLAASLLAVALAAPAPAVAAVLLDAVGLLESALWTCGSPGRGTELVPPALPPPAVAALVVVGWWALQPGRSGRIGAVAWTGMVTGSVCWWAVRPEPPAPRAELLPVGDGQAVVVTSARGALLLDTGRWRREAAELLADSGDRRLAVLAVSHADEDHFGGAETVLRTMAVDRLLLPRWMMADAAAVPLLRAARRRGVQVVPVSRGTVLHVAGMRCEVVWPPASGLPPDDNERALVLRVGGSGGSILLTSDIGGATELRLADLGPLKSDVIVIPHHGSRGSTSPAILDRVAPRVALIPAGPLNRYNHPHREVLARLESRGIDYRFPKRDGRCGARLIGNRWVLYPSRED